MKGGCIGLEAFTCRAVPTFDSGCRPLWRLVAVAIIAGIRSAEFDRQIGTRNAEAMVVATIDDHVSVGGHVAGGACEGSGRLGMTTVGRCSVLVGGMTIQTNAVTGSAQLSAVGVVAIAAGHARCEHLALLEGAVIVNLVAHLPIRIVKAASERRHNVRVG